jgi:FtsZ-binding cell division protein ZapB
MSWTIIVASSQGDQLDELRNGAQEIARAIGVAGIEVVEASSVEAVQEQRKSASHRKQLLIVAASLPSRESTRAPHALPGLELIKSITQEVEAPPCILVSQEIKHFLAVQAIRRCELLYVNCETDYVRDCLQVARRLEVVSVNPAQPALPQAAREAAQGNLAANYALVEVDLVADARSAFVRLSGGDPQPLDLDQTEVDELIKESRALAKRLDDAQQSEERWRRYSQQWSTEYRRLGERVHNLLFSTIFRDLYRIGYGHANGNVRLRFNLDQRYFDGAWEAIYDCQNKDFVMLGNMVTVARRARPSNIYNTLATSESYRASDQIDVNDGVLHMIVIQSDVPDQSIPQGPNDPLWDKYWGSKTLSDLPHVKQEVQMLRTLGRVGTRAGQGGASGARVEVEVLAPRGGKALADQVQRRLEDRSRHYDIIHFAGHALFDRTPQDGRGYLVFSGRQGDEPSAVPIATVADWVEGSGVQLVYLSCCRSSAAAAALELAAHNVPITIGYNWNLSDSKAVDFARDFYTELLNARLKVCPAFSKARRQLYRLFRGGDPIWAAPVLIAQPVEWGYVEGALRPVCLGHLTARKVRRGTSPRRGRSTSDPSSAPAAA